MVILRINRWFFRVFKKSVIAFQKTATATKETPVFMHYLVVNHHHLITLQCDKGNEINKLKNIF